MSEVVFKRSKAKLAQRTRQSSPDANGNDAEIVEDSPSTLATKLKNKAKRAKPKARLSFGGDDEEGAAEVFQVKKSSLSRKLTLGTHPASKSALPVSLDQASISSRSNTGPTYDAAYLNELKASTPTARPSLPNLESYDADISMDAGDVPMQDIQTVDVFESETTIPAESSIQVAKERRERLRKTGAAGEDDFISLTVTRRADEPQGPHPESRLVREEDELGEGDDEYAEYTSAQERIALGKKSMKVEASKRRDAMKEMIADAEEEDDETMEWEESQLRRGGHSTPEPNAPAPKPIYHPAPIPPSSTIPTLSGSIARLTQSLSTLTTSHSTNSNALSTLADERAEVDKREAELRQMVQKAEEKRAWFAAFREWVESVATFLDEKYPQVERLEDELVSLIHERAELISQRRRAEDQDDLSTFLRKLPTSAPPDETDEHGRVIPKPTPATRRAARIARRSRRRARNTSGQPQDEEGYSTDSSLPAADATSYQAALQDLSSQAGNVLSDVRAPEFLDPTAGVGGSRKGKKSTAKGLALWWGEWREKWEESYVGAWGGLGLVGAWEFWVRLEGLGWNCVEDARSLDSFNWYKGLHDYSRPQHATNGDDVGEDDAPELGPDGDLVSAMISTAVIPRLYKLVEGGALDVYSEKDVRRMIDLAEEVEASVEKGNAKLQMLLKAVHTSFATAISDTEALLSQFPSGSQRYDAPMPFNPEAIPARRRYLARRVKLLRNLLRWRKYTGERFGVGESIIRLVRECLLNVAERGGWDVGGEEAIRKVAAVLPRELLPADIGTKLGIH